MKKTRATQRQGKNGKYTTSLIVVKNITLCIKRRIFIKVPRVLYAKNALSLQGDNVCKGSKLSVLINL